MARFLSRIGRFSATHRALVLAAWGVVIAIAGTIGVSGLQFGGGFDIPGSESSEALEIVEDEFGSANDEGRGTLQLVVQAPAGQDLISGTNAELLSSWREDVAALEHVTSVSDPLDATSGGMLSSDGSTSVLTVSYADIDDATAADSTAELESIAGTITDDGFVAEVGSTLADPSATPAVSIAEVAGVAIAFIVLLITLGSLLAAGANMLMAFLGVGLGALSILAYSALTPIGPTTLTLATMLGLAVGIDYGLFILARVRAELRGGRAVPDAVGHAVGTAGTAVVFAGGTVIIALSALAVVKVPFITEMGLAGAVGVLIAVLASLTLLPALIGLIGLRVLPRKERRARSTVRSTTGRAGVLEGWGAAITRRPVIALVGSVAGLVALSIPVLSMTTALSIPGGEDSESHQRRAYDLIAEEFGAGAQDPLVILAAGDDVDAALPDVTAFLTDLPDVVAVQPGMVSAGGDYALLTVIAKEGPVDQSTQDLIKQIRSSAEKIDGVQLRVTGQAAIGIDIDARLAEALVVYIALIVGLAILLMVVLFRSILIPVVATLGFLLSLGTSLGVTVMVFQWGWLDPIIAAPQGNPLMSMLPLLLTGILFGLAMDYQVFLVSRIQEAYARGLAPKAAVTDGFGRSAFVVVAAALIMFSVFGGFGLSHVSTVAAIGTALGIGVLADAFIVRMVIMPAVLSLAGTAAWWIPAWLDRFLPPVDADGVSIERHSGSAHDEALR